MLRKLLIPFLAIFAVAYMLPADASAQLGKKGGGKGEGKAGGPSKGNGGGGQSGGPSKGNGGGVGQSGGPSKGNGGGGGQSGGGQSGGLGKGGGGNSGGGSQSGDRGGYQSGGPSRTSGGGGYQSGGPSRTSGGGGYQNGGPSRTSGQDGRGTLDKDVFRKTQPSRSGTTHYGTESNLNTSSRRGGPIRIPEAPTIRFGSNGLGHDVLREDRTIVNRSFRRGYCQYNPFWVDDWFYYPHYVFEYNPGYCYASPFYYYPNVPGYIASIRVITGNFAFVILAQDRYNYSYHRGNYGGYGGYGGGYSRNDSDLIDYQIDNLVDAFQNGRISYMERMIPRDGTITVELEDQPSYRMYSNDFFDMLADIVEGTDTVSYRITDVRYGRGQYVVYAEHTYRDPWGRIERKFHTIVMERDREGYEIAYFRVDRDRSYDRDNGGYGGGN